jgi:hypothetical protein
MASASLTADSQQARSGSNHDLWIGAGSVLTISINKQSKAWAADEEQCGYLNRMIQGLARAAKSVKFHADNDVSVDTDFVMQPVEDIADAIVLLSQLSEAIRAEART